MVEFTVKRDPTKVDIRLAKAIRDAVERAIVTTMRVRAEDVESDIVTRGRYARNAQPLVIKIETGSGKRGRRIKQCRALHAQINDLIADAVPRRFRTKQMSNLWLVVYAKGASSPIGRRDLQH